jgi:hypothetical protein
VSEDLRDYLKGYDWSWIREQEQILEKINDAQKCSVCGQFKGKRHICPYRIKYVLKCAWCGKRVEYAWGKRYGRGTKIRKYCGTRCASFAAIVARGDKLSEKYMQTRGSEVVESE